MTVDFNAKKLEQRLGQVEDPFQFETLEILYKMYLAGEVDVNFINGEPFFEIAANSLQLELPLEYK
tara:strand:+ start:289 stop:486 length:198 start_codon:yes stop_codon:yes gene_type:complete